MFQFLFLFVIFVIITILIAIQVDTICFLDLVINFLLKFKC